jgi:hypothetical protein
MMVNSFPEDDYLRKRLPNLCVPTMRPSFLSIRIVMEPACFVSMTHYFVGRGAYAYRSKNGGEFDAQKFLATIGEGRKAILFPKWANFFEPLGSRGAP